MHALEQLRLWCLQVPLPKVAPLIVAAKGIPNDVSADDLFPDLWHIVSGLIDRKIQVTSYAADGSNVERNVQRLLEQHATKTITIRIKHPSDGHPDIRIELPFFGSHPFVIPIANLQDSKHLLKTFRNNLYSGARLLTFPNGVAMFSQVREMAFDTESPLFRRDVEKLDRQDDNAATRLFCAASLQWLESRGPEFSALVVYLFVFGDLIDAYQNRSISITERIQIVLRAYFFLEMWEEFLLKARYPKSKHFISSQCAAIAHTLSMGFVKLVVIYRDHVEGSPPLLPWLLCTEVIEHVFGLCRQIVKDFTEKDFRDMEPKLFIKIRQAIFTAHATDGKARASGYSHTYTDGRGINMTALSLYPTNRDIDEAAVRAYGEAESLFGFLGVSSRELHASSTILPGIQSWVLDDHSVPDLVEDTNDSDLLCDEEDESDYDDYQAVIDSLEDSSIGISQQKKLNRYRYATIALSVDEQMEMCVKSFLMTLDSDDIHPIEPSSQNLITTITSRPFRMTQPALPKFLHNRFPLPTLINQAIRSNLPYLMSRLSI